MVLTSETVGVLCGDDPFVCPYLFLFVTGRTLFKEKSDRMSSEFCP